MSEDKFFKFFGLVAVFGSLFLLMLAPLFGYIGRVVRQTYNLDFVVGLYITTAPFTVFWGFLIIWAIISYRKYQS